MRLSRQTGRRYRLPSEAEWEYACRAGALSVFHFGETLSRELANYNDASRTSSPKLALVGVSGLPNAFGLYDIAAEWCLDTVHPTYDGAPQDGSAWQQGTFLAQRFEQADLAFESWPNPNKE